MARGDGPADGGEAAVAVCENCAGDDDDLQAVWPASGTGEGAELWCSGCRAEFDHEVAADGEGDDEEGDGAG